MLTDYVKNARRVLKAHPELYASEIGRLYKLDGVYLAAIRKRMGINGLDRTKRFWMFVDKSDKNDCWEWTAGRHACFGYGVYRYEGKPQYAHRVSWKITNGSIPKGLHILHRCDNPPCVNPGHLYTGTSADNVRDRDTRGNGAVNRRKLSVARIREIKLIRMMYKKYVISQKELTALFGEHKSTMSKIINRNLYDRVL